MNVVTRISVYVDRTDEADPQLALIKGGGGALTREKIFAYAPDMFVCVVDSSKLPPTLGVFPLPIEISPMAAALVSRQTVSMSASPTICQGITTDNRNMVIDIVGLRFSDPCALETELNQLPGGCNGVFARRRVGLCISRHVRCDHS